MTAVRLVDVFSDRPFRGNALAVLHDADDLTDEEMLAVARWTNLSETTFLLAPTDPGADYRVRIWTIGGELPFAGHPTLGSAHAWLEAGGAPQRDGVVVQECGAGLVEVRRDDGRLRFAAPPLRRSGPVDPAELERVVAALRLDPADVLEAAWVDNGPGWLGLLLRSPEAVLAADPDRVRASGMKVGLAGRYTDGERDDGVALEVRAFYSDDRDFGEDPVTGSLNAGLAQWLVPAGHLPERYVAAQGTVIGREGRVHVAVEDGVTWVGGATHTLVAGERPASIH
ncbi:PhzF family phenazine biosynthesis protein [Phycicoccus sonneratiae]|uniref:PhzF family phenazine biosynthesis protein n=1 Tax=Phycicoccus sonneratiae TaxID=2807628 RepID=A0ABS2CRZ2_9MICO|nr:PhzF family phenazine biosynthesis protein [Phycicoccus sonneraticus]MBM6401921.1 PhzF family phenazine biosynthesis protein [Phycicoccus sonneraticus]